MDKKQSIFEVLASVDVSKFTEKKNGLTYLSWSHAWAETKKRYPTASYSVQHNPETQQPFWYDVNLGYMVQTIVTIDSESIPMQLPVLDGANQAMKSEPYTYKVQKKKWSEQYNKMIAVKDANGNPVYEDKAVERATMFDINTAIMRCLTKNLAMFGLGLNVYAGEDLPLVQSEDVTPTALPKVDKVVPTKKLTKDQEKALESFNKLDKAKVLEYLIKEAKLTYDSVDDFVAGEKIEKVREIYKILTTK